MTIWIGLTGFVQGVILSAVIFRNRKHKSNLYLAWFTSLLSLLILISVFQESALVLFPYAVILNFVPYLFGPLIYFYLHHSFYRSFTPRGGFRVHLIPAVLDLFFYGIILLVFSRAELIETIQDVLAGRPPLFVTLLESGKMLSGIIYSLFIVRLVLSFQKDLKQWMKNKEQGRWAVAMAAVFVSCWAVVIFNYVWLIAGDESISLEFLFSVQIATFVLAMYVITFFAMRYPELFSKEQVRVKIARKLNLGESGLEKISTALVAKMQKEKLFLQDDLSLGSLAEEVGVHPNALSFVINESFGQNFNEFINGYRLEHFISLLKNDTESTILRLAFDSGFNSKSVFNRVFKEKFDLSPVEYRNTL